MLLVLLLPSQSKDITIVLFHGNGATVLVPLTESADLDLSPLALLHQEARCSVFKDLRKVAGDRVVLAALQCMVGFGAISSRIEVLQRYGPSPEKLEILLSVSRGDMT